MNHTNEPSSRMPVIEIEPVDLPPLLPPSAEEIERRTVLFERARQYGCALYDGLYLALAESTQLPLIYADTRLRNTLGGQFLRELWIEDYPI